MKEVNGHEIIQLFESFSPKYYAVDGDSIGLQIGRLNKPVKNVMIALDVLDEVVDEAIEKDIQLIIAHHPPIFRPLKHLQTEQSQGKLIEKLIKHDIAVYAAHTNLDVAEGGVNDLLAEALGLYETVVLDPIYEEKLKKLVVYVPADYAKKVQDVLGNTGAGSIGEYSHCSFSTEGIGSFLPGKETTPFIGEPGKIEEVQEVKIETIYPERIEKKILSAMIKAHPYEEVAYDIYQLDNKGTTLGLGRVGYLKEEISLKEFAEHVKNVLEVKTLRVVGNLNDRIKKVAVLGGDGNKYFTKAKFKGADVFVTGDFYYHNAHDAMNLGLNIVDPGHNVEKVMKSGVANIMTKMCTEKGYSVKFLASTVHTDPFQFI